MNSTLTKDARGFVDGVVSMLKTSGKTKSVAPKVHSILRKMTEQSRRDSVAKVQTSILLDSGEKQTLSNALSQIFNREVSVEVTIVPEIIAGFRLQVGDWVYDTSVHTQLIQMADGIMEENV